MHLAPTTHPPSKGTTLHLSAGRQEKDMSVTFFKRSASFRPLSDILASANVALQRPRVAQRGTPRLADAGAADHRMHMPLAKVNCCRLGTSRVIRGKWIDGPLCWVRRSHGTIAPRHRSMTSSNFISFQGAFHS